MADCLPDVMTNLVLLHLQARQDPELDGAAAALALKARVTTVRGGKEEQLVAFAMRLLSGESSELGHDRRPYTDIELCSTAIKLILTKAAALTENNKIILVLYCAEMAACGMARAQEQALALATVFNLADPAPFKHTRFQLKEMLSSRDETPLVNAMFCTFANKIGNMPDIKESLMTRFLTANL